MNLAPYSNGSVVIACMGFGGFVSVTEIQAAGAIEYLDSFESIAKGIIKESGGSDLGIHVGDMTVAWASDAMPVQSRVVGAAVEIADVLKRKIEDGGRYGYPRRQISIGMSAGSCAVQIMDGRVVDVMGKPLVAAGELYKRSRETGVSVVIDQTLFDAASPGFDVREIGAGLFSVLGTR